MVKNGAVLQKEKNSQLLDYNGKEIITNPENKVVNLTWTRKLKKPIKDLDLCMTTEHGVAKELYSIPAQAF